MDGPNPQRTPLLGRFLASLGPWARRLDGVKSALILLPFVCLLGYWIDAGIPWPGLLLSERRYLAVGQAVSAERFQALRGTGEAFAVLPDRLVPAPRGAQALDELRASLPDQGVLGPVLLDLERGLGPFRKARVITDQAPLPSEWEALRQAAGPVPLIVEVVEPPAPVPVQALGIRYSATDQRVPFDLLLGPEALGAAAIEVRTRGSQLFQATGPELPKDRVLRLSAPRDEASSLEVTFKDASGRTTSRRLSLGTEADEQPKVLVIGERADRRSFIEALYPSRRSTLPESEGLDLMAYELVVLDGVPLGRIRGRLLSSLLEMAQRRTGSVLFVADSPDFGKKGDNPELEELLPVTLLPRSLKDLPDLAVLILIDVSGSMFGDKLSLAKVTGLELLRNLKPSDRVGMLLFSDERRWAYPFQTNSAIKAAPVLEPLTAGGGTDLHPALAEGLERLAEQPIKAKHAVVVTDGVTKPADFQALADRARSLGISLSAMGVGEDVNRSLLERLALQTGGRYYPVLSTEAIPGLLFEDRMTESRAVFGQGRIPILAMNGERVASVSGMAQYTPTPTASVLFASDVGDPLLAGRELGNRAVLFFGSDLYGAYTRDFFASPTAAGGFKDRLDALFARRPAQVRVVETARGLTVLARSDTLAAPVLLLSRSDASALEVPFRRSGTEGWAAETVPPLHGRWNATILDRGGSLASFALVVNGGMGGTRSDAATALAGHSPRIYRWVHLPALWLGLFFTASLACTVMLRVKR